MAKCRFLTCKGWPPYLFIINFGHMNRGNTKGKPAGYSPYNIHAYKQRHNYIASYTRIYRNLNKAAEPLMLVTMATKIPKDNICCFNFDFLNCSSLLIYILAVS